MAFWFTASLFMLRKYSAIVSVRGSRMVAISGKKSGTKAEILVDGTGQTKEGKERYRIIDPVKGWTSAAVCKARPGFKNTRTFQEFMDAQAKRGQPKLW